MSSRFITESEAADLRQKRQEEWEKVRQANDPVERPEEPYDARSLYDRLQEQKQKKDLEYEEAHKLKNMIKGLDDDEIEFLDLVDRTKMAADRKINIEEQRELDDYRNRVACLQEQSLDQKLQAQVKVRKPKAVSNNSRSSQVKLLKGIVLKNDVKKRKHSDTDDSCPDDTTEAKKPNAGADVVGAVKIAYGGTGLTCIGILPGLGCYNDDSSSDVSSDTDRDEIPDKLRCDMLGRKILKKKES